MLVSLSLTLMFKQAEASKDRAGGQGGLCRCTELAGIATLSALPRNVCHRKSSIQELGLEESSGFPWLVSSVQTLV